MDVHVQQLFSAPTLYLDVDRTRAQTVGLSEQDVANSLLLTLSSSFQINPSFWVNPANGMEYNVAVQVPQYKVDSMQSLDNIPDLFRRPRTPAAIAQQPGAGESEYAAGADHALQQSAHDRHLRFGGRARPRRRGQRHSQGHDGFPGQAPARHADGAARPSRHHDFLLRRVWARACCVAIVLVYLLIVVNFQSWLDPFIIITALPGALAGIVWMLLLTHTTLSVPSLTGTIMCMGVATANSILLVSFARERLNRRLSCDRSGARSGLRPHSPGADDRLAMIIGMVPMSLGLGEGGEQNAPLGRAVIGGLIVATFATLFFVPCVFSLVHRTASRHAHGEMSRRDDLISWIILGAHCENDRTVKPCRRPASRRDRAADHDEPQRRRRQVPPGGRGR